jgi:hypothetical protein
VTIREDEAALNERIRQEVATWPPLTEIELNELALLLRPMARAIREIRRSEQRAGKQVAA